MNKKLLSGAVLSFQIILLIAISCATSRTPANESIMLDRALQMAAVNIEENVGPNMKIALLNFSSPSEQFSSYVLEELSTLLVNGKKLVVVERNELELIRQEENFQMSGEVSDKSAQAIGKKLGAQHIVSGNLSTLGNVYRFRTKVLNVETAAIEASFSSDLDMHEARIVFLLDGSKPILRNEQQRPASRNRPGEVYGDIENFKQKLILPMLGRVFSVAISPDNTQYAAVTAHGYKVFDLLTGRELYTFLEDEKDIHRNIIYSPDGKQIMVIVWNEIRIWDSKTGKLLRTLVRDLTGYPNTEWDGIKLHDAINSQRFNSAVYSPDGKYIAAVSSVLGDRGGYQDNCIRVWDANSGLQLLDNMEAPYTSLIFYSKDGKSIGGKNVYGEDISFNAETGLEQAVPASIFYPISQDADYYGHGSFKWNTSRRSWDYGFFYDGEGIGIWSFSPDGLRLANVVLKKEDKKYYIQLFDSKTGLLLSEYLGNSPLSIEPVVLMYNPQGTRIFCSLEDGTIKIFDARTGEEINPFGHHGGVISSAKFSNDGNYLIVGTVNGTITLYGK